MTETQGIEECARKNHFNLPLLRELHLPSWGPPLHITRSMRRLSVSTRY